MKSHMKSQMIMGVFPGYVQKNTTVTFRCSRCKDSKITTGRKRIGSKEMKLGWICADCAKKDEVK